MAPDFNFTNRNLLEALMEIGRYIGGIPILDMTGFEDNAATTYLIKYIMLNEDTTTSSANYLTTSNTTSPALYTDGLRSEVNNLVVKDEQASSYIWPAASTYGYARCALGEELTSSNMEIQLPEPVYHINKLNLRYDNSTSKISYVYIHQSSSTQYKYHYVSLGDYITYEDVPIIENTVYAVLPTQHSATDVSGSELRIEDVGKYQDTSIYFTSGQNNLYIKGGYQYKYIFSATSDVLTNILIAYLNSLPAPQPTIIINGETYTY